VTEQKGKYKKIRVCKPKKEKKNVRMIWNSKQKTMNQLKRSGKSCNVTHTMSKLKIKKKKKAKRKIK